MSENEWVRRYMGGLKVTHRNPPEQIQTDPQLELPARCPKCGHYPSTLHRPALEFPAAQWQVRCESKPSGEERIVVTCPRCGGEAARLLPLDWVPDRCMRCREPFMTPPDPGTRYCEACSDG